RRFAHRPRAAHPAFDRQEGGRCPRPRAQGVEMTMAQSIDRTPIEENFPGLADLVPREAPEQVQARLWDGSQFEGELAGFFAKEQRLELRLADPGSIERIRFGDLQW